MGYGILVVMETKNDFDFKSGRRLNKMSHFCYFVSIKLFLCRKRVFTTFIFFNKEQQFSPK